MSVGSIGVAVLAAVAGTVLVLSIWARVRFERRFSFFRCRIGPAHGWWRRARWRLGRCRAAWVGTVLVVQSRPLPLWLTPLAVRVRRGETVRFIGGGQVRLLGREPVALRLVTDDDRELEVAVAGHLADRVVGPFLMAALPQRPPAPRRPSP